MDQNNGQGEAPLSGEAGGTFTWVVIWVILLSIVIILGLGVYYFFQIKNQSNELQPSIAPTTQSIPEDLDAAIKKFVLANAAPEITDVKITDKKIISDQQGTKWAKFNITPIPENAADPAYGFMKKVGNAWEGVNFGTSLVEESLPTEVKEKFGY